jgi:hypothetical protein
MQYAAINGWILGNSNGQYQTTYNGTIGVLGTALTTQPTLFGTDLQCVPDVSPATLIKSPSPFTADIAAPCAASASATWTTALFGTGRS